MDEQVQAIKDGFFSLELIVIVWGALIYFAISRVEKAIKRADASRKEGK